MSERPDLAYWGGKSEFSLRQAAYLFEGLSPRPKGDGISGAAYDQLDRLKDYFTARGRIPAGRGRAKADETRVSREELTAYAEHYDLRPAFLYSDSQPQRNSPGRPTREPEITSAYESLRKDGKIDFGQPQARAIELVDQALGRKGPKRKTIEKFVGPLFNRDKLLKS